MYAIDEKVENKNKINNSAVGGGRRTRFLLPATEIYCFLFAEKASRVLTLLTNFRIFHTAVAGGASGFRGKFIHRGEIFVIRLVKARDVCVEFSRV